jgi:cytochrome c-type biogenesis protein CcmF
LIQIANVSLVLAAVFSLWGIFASLVSARGGRDHLHASAERTLYAVFAYVCVAAVCLLYFLVVSDFRIEYVASYTSSTLPLFYKVAALWAGQKGSLLLWSILLTGFSSIAVYTNRKRNRDIVPHLIAILLSINLFFLLLMLFVSSPFERLAVPPVEGRGLNPLLQNPGMVFHPPSLYLGFVGFTIPFAFAMASMIKWKDDTVWIRSTRRWVLLAWVFLTIGNLLGAQWAYVELGWGGYWAWDPVENAAIMPWFTGTAFLHSVMIQEKKNMLKVWNMVLVIITFLLTIFGTFLTRSGVISSVHAFTESGIGPFFVAFMIVIAVFSIYVLVTRFSLLRTTNRFDSVLSRESTFLFNNLILLGASFAVLWGTVFPLVSEAVRGTQITVGPPFFNAIMIPIGILLLLLIGVGPLIAWRRASMGNLRENFLIPLLLTLVSGGIFYALLGVRETYPLISFMLVVFVLVTIAVEFYRGTKARRRSTGEGLVRAFSSLVWKGKRRYGGYIVHLGVVFVYIGITGTAFNVEKEMVLAPGETDEIEGYTVRYEGLKNQEDAHKTSVTATLQLRGNGRDGNGDGLIAILKPQKNFYRHPEQATTEVAIHSTPLEDFYVIFAGFDGEVGTFRMLVNPLVMWLWIGGWVMVIGTVIAIWPDRRARRRKEVLYDLHR